MADSGTMTLGCGSRRHFLRAGAALVALHQGPASFTSPMPSPPVTVIKNKPGARPMG